MYPVGGPVQIHFSFFGVVPPFFEQYDGFPVTAVMRHGDDAMAIARMRAGSKGSSYSKYPMLRRGAMNGDIFFVGGLAKKA